MIQIRPVDAQDEEVWRALLELRERYLEGWTLIGARMVTLYALEHDRTPPRFSLDADARSTCASFHALSAENTSAPGGS